MNAKAQIAFSDFEKVDIRVGLVKTADLVPDSRKLLKLLVDFGDLGERVVFSGIKPWVDPSELEGKQVCFVVNLQPRKMSVGISEAMILASEGPSGEFSLIVPEKPVPNGSAVH